MRKLSFLASCCLTALLAQTQQFPVDTLVKNRSSNRINIVYMGDGYTTGEMSQFTSDVTNINTQLFQTSPFKEYAAYFNVFSIKIPSGESGAKHPNNAPDCVNQPTGNPLNYFGSRFDAFGIHRLVVADSLAKAQLVLANNFPNFHVPVLIVNSTYYGGSGGWLVTSTRNINSPEIAIHELAHSFASLADEYWAGPQYAAERANMTQQSVASLVKWKNWMGVGQVGIYAHTGNATWFKPSTANCKMELLSKAFCPVCREAIVERIHQLVKPIDAFLPAASTIIINGGNQGFKLNLVPPNPNTLKVTWSLDNNIIKRNVDSVTLSSTELGAGSHVLSAVVTDTTAFTKDAGHFTNHSYLVQWTINMATGIISPELTAAKIKIFPNPFADQLNASYELDKRSDIKIEIFNTNGQLLYKTETLGQSPGKHHQSLITNGKKLMPGIYLVRFSLNGQSVTEEKIKIN